VSTQRPFTRAERDYLERHKEVLDAAFNAFAITVGLLALPVAFVAFTLGGHAGLSGARLSTALSGFIMLALIGAVVYYTALGRQEVRFDRAAFQRRRALGLDLERDEAHEEAFTVSAKSQEAAPAHAAEPNRRLYVTADGRRFQLSAAHWMAIAEGETVTLTIAPHSGVVLAVDGEADRIRLPRRRDAAPEGTPIGGG
jgi:hypothetical protein